MSLAIMGLMFTETTPKININNYENIFLTASAEETQTFIGDSYGLQLEYKVLSDETIEITKFISATSSVIELPPTIDGKKVTSIGEWAFLGCSSLISVTIPDGVTSIRNSTFRECTSLNNITIPNSVTSICWGAFYRCTSLTSISIPNSVTSIGVFAFEYCSNLSSIMIPDNVTSIGNGAFSNCTSLEKINVSENNKYYISIDGVLFSEDHTRLVAYPIGRTNAEYTIPYVVTKIAPYAFDHCSSLSSITIPDGVTSIGDEAFYSCKNLTSITIPDSVMSIGGDAFYNTPFLNSQKTDVKYAGEWAVDCNKTVTSVEIKDGTKGIAVDVFYCHSKLTSITIPDSVTNIGDGAFYGCTNLSSITIPNNMTCIGDSVFANCKSLTSMIIPNSVTSIGEYAFSDCTSLTSIMIPNSVTNIGWRAFEECTSLSNITIKNPNCIIYDSSNTISRNTVIYGYKNSTAQEYADKNNRKFIAIDENPAITTPAVTTAITTTLVSPEPINHIGDITSDGKINIFDLTALKRAINNGATSKLSFINSDINSDGKIDYYDCAALQYFLVNKTLPERSITQYYENFSSESIIDESDAKEIILENQESMGLSQKGLELVFNNSETIENCDFYHYDLTYNDIPVYGKEITVSADQNDNPYLMIGNCEEIADISTVPYITAEQAVNIANNETGQQNFTDAKLVLYPVEDKFVLAYICNSMDSLNVIDAQNGSVIKNESTLLTATETFEGQILGDYQTVTYNDLILNEKIIKNVLFDTERKIGVFKRDNIPENFLTIDQLKEMYLQEEIHNEQYDFTHRSAVDAMSNITRSFDFFDTKFSFNNFTSISVIVNSDCRLENIHNALAETIYENNDCFAIIRFTPTIIGPEFSAYLDVSAHEYTHCVTDKKAFGRVGYDANYLERGALMEAYSDIFGELIELESTGKNDWIIGKNTALMEKRNLKEPQKNKNPDKYNGDWFYRCKNASEYAHKNSTVISHAAYLMYNGYNGIGLSADELAKVWYMSLQYLSSTSTMQDCSNAVIKSAELLLSNEKVEIVKQAFREVGLSDSIPITYNVISKNAQIKVIDKNSQTYTGDYKINIYNVYNPANSGPFDINDYRTFNTKKLVEERIVKSSDLTDDCFNYDFANDGYYLINVSPADDSVTGSGNRLVCVKSGAYSGRTDVVTDFEKETTDDLIVETVKLTNSDIKPEWDHVTSLNFEYPVFKSKNKEVQDFLTDSVTEKILSYMATNVNYNVEIYGDFSYDTSIDGFLSVHANIANHAEGGNGHPYFCHTFFVDLKNKKVLQLNDLFYESEDMIYSEIALKATAYISDKCSAMLFSKDALNNYDYSKCKYTLTKEKLIITFNPYEIAPGAAGFINIEIPVSDLNLACIIPEIKTKGFQKDAVENSINNYLSKNWNGENNYYVFNNDILEKNDYLNVNIRWNGSNSANALTGYSCMVDKKTGLAKIYHFSTGDKVIESFKLSDYM